ncbi:MAG: hypothetical protein ACYTDW_00785 [Planctomycetota bacterium]|jgi:hypothetical protein
MRRKIIILAMLTTVVVGLSVLLVAKYLDIQTRHIASSLTPLFSQMHTYLKPGEYLPFIEKTCFFALIFLLITIRTSMIRKVT